MDTPQTPQPLPTKSNLSRYVLFGAIALIAVVSVALAVALPKETTTDDRSKAAIAGACIAQASVAGSACNEKCGADADCSTGMVCYKSTTGATEGMCRSASNVTSTTCSGTTACTQACTTTADCAVGKTCVGTNVITGAASAVVTATRAATATELAALAADQIIFTGPGNGYKFDAAGNMTFSVIARKAGTFFVDFFKIGPGGVQTSVLTKTFSIGANQVVTGTIHIPACGGYQIDYGSTLVIGTKYDLNTTSHYFWGTLTNLACTAGCCQ